MTSVLLTLWWCYFFSWVHMVVSLKRACAIVIGQWAWRCLELDKSLDTAQGRHQLFMK